MQKVEGSNPFSRSGKGLRLQVFFVRLAGLAPPATALAALRAEITPRG